MPNICMEFRRLSDNCKHMTMQLPYDEDKEELGDEKEAFCDFGEGGKLGQCTEDTCPILIEMHKEWDKSVWG